MGYGSKGLLFFALCERRRFPKGIGLPRHARIVAHCPSSKVLVTIEKNNTKVMKLYNSVQHSSNNVVT